MSFREESSGPQARAHLVKLGESPRLTFSIKPLPLPPTPHDTPTPKARPTTSKRSAVLAPWRGIKMFETPSQSPSQQPLHLRSFADHPASAWGPAPVLWPLPSQAAAQRERDREKTPSRAAALPSRCWQTVHTLPHNTHTRGLLAAQRAREKTNPSCAGR